MDLDHSGRSVVTWSLNAPSVSRRFEAGIPSFDRRPQAAVKLQATGSPVRIRLDPIVPVEGWRDEYAETIRCIFKALDSRKISCRERAHRDLFVRHRRDQEARVERHDRSLQGVGVGVEAGGVGAVEVCVCVSAWGGGRG